MTLPDGVTELEDVTVADREEVEVLVPEPETDCDRLTVGDSVTVADTVVETEGLTLSV